VSFAGDEDFATDGATAGVSSNSWRKRWYAGAFGGTVDKAGFFRGLGLSVAANPRGLKKKRNSCFNKSIPLTSHDKNIIFRDEKTQNID
jgi:hypothetical protein